MKKTPLLVWFRQDLRLKDNPALSYACQTDRPVIPLYILDDKSPKKWKMGGASRWWLHYSLTSLDESLKKKGSRLFLLQGDALEILPRLVKKYKVEQVCWNRCYEPFAISRDEKLKRILPHTKSFNGSLLFEPWEICNQQKTFFKVFTPFWKRCCELLSTIDSPLPEPKKIQTYKISSEPLNSFALLPHHPDWAGGLRATWKVGEQAAHQRLVSFLKKDLGEYGDGHDRPGLDCTSKLSAHLHFGEISPRQVYHTTKEYKNNKKFLSELGWREFSYSQLYHFPKLPEQPWREEFSRFPWNKNSSLLKKWQKGETGYPIVDAGMRQLWKIGWMHNRVRMIVASFLIKDLFLHWKEGESWFWDTLVDADLANNSASWQWVAGCGFDSAPFFRIFNPTLQGEKFDPEGMYVKRWIPELEKVPKQLIHTPLAYDPHAHYPEPIIDHREARQQALKAFQQIKTN